LLGVVGSAVRFFAGGAGDDAARVREARDAARTLGAYPNEVATTALLAHMLARDGALDDARAELSGLRENPGGFAGILLLRAAAITGDGAAAAQLESVIGELRAPGLSLRLSAAAS